MSRLNKLPPFSAKESPLQFTGISTEANDFLEQYEGLLFKHKITLESDKVKGILRYCSQSIRDWIENRDAFITPDWAQLKADICKYFNADRLQMPYNLGDVHEFSLRQSKKPITNLADWHWYLWHYEAIAGKLKNQQIISLEQFHQYLWTGIEAKLRINSVEPEMKRTYPNHDVTQFYSKDEVETVIERMFAWNKADINIIDAPAFGIQVPSHSRHFYSDDDSDESDIDKEESDSGHYGRKEPRHQRRIWQKKKREMRRENKYRKISEKKNKNNKKAHQAMVAKQDYEEFRGSPEEVEQLLKDMSRMKITDPEYTAKYFKVMLLDTSGTARNFVPKPQMVEVEKKQQGESSGAWEIPPHMEMPMDNQPPRTMYPPRTNNGFEEQYQNARGARREQEISMAARRR